MRGGVQVIRLPGSVGLLPSRRGSLASKSMETFFPLHTNAFVATRYESCVSARVVVETPCPAISLNTLFRFHILFIPNILSGGGCLVSTILIELSAATVCAPT